MYGADMKVILIFSSNVPLTSSLGPVSKQFCLTSLRFKHLDVGNSTHMMFLAVGYYKVNTHLHKHTFTQQQSCVCVPVADHHCLHSFICLALAICQQSLCLLCFLSALLSSSFILSQSLLFTSSQHFKLFFHSILCLSFCSHSQHSSQSPGLLFLSLLTLIPLVPTHLLVFSFDLYPTYPHPPSYSFFFPFLYNIHLSFSLCLPFYLFLSDIYNEKSSRRELTHTWPSSVTAAVTDNLSSDERIGHFLFSLFFFFTLFSRSITTA